jgi:hypothetical protein
MSSLQRHRVDVRLAQHDRSTFLAMVSSLHRRGVEVVAAELLPMHGASPTFSATFLATSTHASTVAATLRNRVEVFDAELSTVHELATATS